MSSGVILGLLGTSWVFHGLLGSSKDIGDLPEGFRGLLESSKIFCGHMGSSGYILSHRGSTRTSHIIYHLIFLKGTIRYEHS